MTVIVKLFISPFECNAVDRVAFSKILELGNIIFRKRAGAGYLECFVAAFVSNIVSLYLHILSSVNCMCLRYCFPVASLKNELVICHT